MSKWEQPIDRANEEIEKWKARAEAAEKERDHLREKLFDLLSWFPDRPTEPQWQLVAGEFGADDAIDAARAAAEVKP